MIRIFQKSKLITFLSLLVFFVEACGPGSEDIVKQKFTRASDFYDEKKFNDAMLVLDSIKEEFSGDIEYVTRAEDLIRKMKIGEQERNLVYLDSLLNLKQKDLDVLMKNFDMSTKYGDEEILIHKRQKPTNSYSRSYIRAHLNMKGDFYISSRYVGPKYIYHDQIKVYNKGQSVISEKIPYDDLDNHRFEDGGTYWEVVNYKNNSDNGIIDFIAENVDKPLKVEFIGKSRYYIVMEKYDKQAIADGYEISFVLKELDKLKTEIKKSKDLLKHLQ